MAKRFYGKCVRFAILTGGASLTAVEVVGAGSYLTSQSSPAYLIAGGILVTLVAATLPSLAMRCWREKRRILALLLWAALLPALSLIVGAAVERTGTTRDQANGERQAAAQRIALARDTERDAKAELDSAEQKATAECSRAVKGADPRGPQCKAAETRADTARQRVQAARDQIGQAGVVQVDPQARRIAAVLPGVSEEQVALYFPLVLPLSITTLGLLLIAAGSHTRKPKVTVKRKRRQRRKTKQKPRPPHQGIAAADLGANVVPFRRLRATG